MRDPAGGMATTGRAECVLVVIWDELLTMSGDDNGVEIRVMGALPLGSRVLSGLRWEERCATEEGWTAMGEMTAHYPRAGQMREIYEACVHRAEAALEAWE